MLRAMARIFVSLMVLSFAGSAAMAAKRVALVIGNSAYANAPALTTPRNDAEDMAAALKALGFTVIVGTDLDKRAMDRKILEFAGELSGAEAGVFHYSGHGLQVAGVNYLVPVDAELATTEALDFEAVRLDLVQRTMERKTNTNILFLDACRNNPLTRNLARALGTRSVDIGHGLAAAELGVGTLISFSTQPGNVALDGQGRNSPYSGPLAKAIGTPGEDILSILTAVRNEVLAATSQKQVPWENHALTAKFYFNPAASGPAGAAAALSADAQAWSVVQNSSSEAVLEEFVRRFPHSVYAGFAKARMDELKRQPDPRRARDPGPQTQQAKPAETQTAVVAAKTPPVLPKPSEDACVDGLLVSVSAGRKPCIKPGSGESFKDCANCPEMVVVPSGSFTMGSPDSELERASSEGPQHEVRIAKPFAVGRFAVTFAEWDACVAERGCDGYKPEDGGWGRADRPVINVNWDDAQTYVQWLSKKTGKGYRLLTEAEREYVTRAGKKTPFWWGTSISASQANYDGNYSYAEGEKDEYRRKTLPVKSFQANPWGLYQVHGNVWEWVEDCLEDSYRFAPADGSARATYTCDRVIRGGSWTDEPQCLRAACRKSGGTTTRFDIIGFRVARNF